MSTPANVAQPEVSAPEPTAFYAVERPTLLQRLLRLVWPQDHPSFSEQQEDDANKAQMPGWFATNVFVDMSWRCRIGALLSGRIVVRMHSRADAVINEIRTVSAVSALPPRILQPDDE